jgi:hypothetical protein
MVCRASKGPARAGQQAPQESTPNGGRGGPGWTNLAITGVLLALYAALMSEPPPTSPPCLSAATLYRLPCGCRAHPLYAWRIVPPGTHATCARWTARRHATSCPHMQLHLAVPTHSVRVCVCAQPDAGEGYYPAEKDPQPSPRGALPGQPGEGCDRAELGGHGHARLRQRRPLGQRARVQV